MKPYPFRLGTTSYIIPDAILPNVRYLAGLVQDVELVLFEVDDGPNNLPTRREIDELISLAADFDLTYTVHLPLDLRLADDGSLGHASLEKAKRVIDCTAKLEPWAYVLHLDGQSVRKWPAADAYARWCDQAAASLCAVGEEAGGLAKLAVENLEGYPLDFYDPVWVRMPVSRTVDVGHLWLDGCDPVAYLQTALPRTRVVHLHGAAGGRDHMSLTHMPQDQLRAVCQELIRSDYRGVMTLEVFSQEDFQTSLAALEEILKGDFP